MGRKKGRLGTAWWSSSSSVGRRGCGSGEYGKGHESDGVARRRNEEGEENKDRQRERKGGREERNEASIGGDVGWYVWWQKYGGAVVGRRVVGWWFGSKQGEWCVLRK